MSAQMVIATLNGWKSQTRRGKGLESDDPDRMVFAGYGKRHEKTIALFRDSIPDDPVPLEVACPYGAPGGLLWVREGVRRNERGAMRFHSRGRVSTSVAHFIADGAPAPIDSWGWKNKALPGIHMPRGVCRLELELLDVRVERLNSISEADAIAEGIERDPMFSDRWKNPNGVSFESPIDAYAALWESINGRGTWATNPWCWVLCFPAVKPS